MSSKVLYPTPRRPRKVNAKTIEDLTPCVNHLLNSPERRLIKCGFIGYGKTRPGDKVLIGVDSFYDPLVLEAIITGFKRVGARVDVLSLDAGSDREFEDDEEVKVIMRRKPWWEEVRRYDGIPFIEEIAQREHYDFLVHGNGGYIPETPFRYEAIPWLHCETFASPCNSFPQDLNELINEKAWAPIWNKGRGGKVRITDPEGTDITYTLHEDYYENIRYGGFERRPFLGHLMGHPLPPLVPESDARGVIAGTTSHYCRPFPRIRLHLENGQVVRVEGGGNYGEAWNKLLKEAEGIKYPEFPRPGLFWLWEVAIGTNPKASRPSNITKLSSGGTEWDRWRSGIIHMGLGTLWRGPSERWAAERNFPYGHLHVHLFFPTYELTTQAGEKITIVEKGRLKALDDLEVRRLASRYGDPDEVVKEDWIPAIPGINTDGDYETDYGRRPMEWIKKEQKDFK